MRGIFAGPWRVIGAWAPSAVAALTWAVLIVAGRGLFRCVGHAPESRIYLSENFIGCSAVGADCSLGLSGWAIARVLFALG